MQINRDSKLGALIIQLVQFGAVGGVGYVVNLVVYNLLRSGPLNPEQVSGGTMYAGVVASILAIITNWLGNRYWTFSGHRGGGTLREGIEFFAVSLAGTGIGLLCLWVSHYLLGYTSALADNISLNVVGLILGSVFRFVFYRHWVFNSKRHSRREAKRAPLEQENAAR